MHIQRVVTVYDPDVQKLQDELRSALTKQDIQAIRGGREFFANLAGADSPKWLRKVLQACAEGPYYLQFLSRDNSPYRPYFRFQWQGEPAISLPRKGRLRAGMPAFLRHVYGVIGTFCENGFDMSGGLHSGDELVALSETWMWVDPSGSIDPSTAIPFLETFSGSQLCYLPDGGGAWPKAGKLVRVRSLEREVAKYFEALLKGTRI